MKKALHGILALALVASADCASDEGVQDVDDGDGGSARDGSAPGDASGPRGDAGAAGDAEAAGGDASDEADAGGAGDAGRDAAAESDAAQARDAEGPPEDSGGPAAGRSSGCGEDVSSGIGSFTEKTIQVGDGERTYHVFVPEDYDPERAYPVVFRFHGSGGDGLSGGLGIEDAASSEALIVAPDGRNSTWSWWSGTDLALFDALVTEVGENYCVDQGRLFAYGFSAGAGFTEYLSCKRGDVLRGIGAIASYDTGTGECQGPVAAWLLHDASDEPAPIAGGEGARDRHLEQNGCSMETEPAGSDCVRYLDCDEGYPVVWCETSDKGHDIRGDYAPGEVWKFFSSLP